MGGRGALLPSAIKRKGVMNMKHLFSALLLVLATGILFAQGFGGGMPGGNSGNTLLVNSPKGLFALRAGVLAKFDAATLKSALVFELFGPMPERPTDNNNRDAMQKYVTELQRRMAPPIMLVKDDALLVVIGDGFARINQDTLKVEATADLSPPGAPVAADAGRGFRNTDIVPGYLLVNNTLFLMRGTELLSLSVTDGKILARTPLPKELQPLQLNLPAGGRGNQPAGGGQ